MKKHIFLLFLTIIFNSYSMENYADWFDAQPMHLDLIEQNKQLARLLGYTSFLIKNSVTEKPEQEISSASESSASDEEKDPDVSNEEFVEYKGQQEPIEAFYRRRCVECSQLIWDPKRTITAYRDHWQRIILKK